MLYLFGSSLMPILFLEVTFALYCLQRQIGFITNYSCRQVFFPMFLKERLGFPRILELDWFFLIDKLFPLCLKLGENGQINQLNVKAYFLFQMMRQIVRFKWYAKLSPDDESIGDQGFQGHLLQCGM